MFGAERQIRLRPSYFPFTEPSVEVDVSCLSVVVKDVTYVRRQAGLKSRCWYGSPNSKLEMSGVDLEEYQVSPSVLVKNVLPCFVMVSTIRGFYQGMFASQNSLNKV